MQKKNNGNGKVNEVEAEDEDEEVAAARAGNGTGNGNKNKNNQCSYCNRYGHVVKNCRTKARDSKRQQSNSPNNANGNGPNVNSNKSTNDSQSLVNNLLHPKSINAVDYTDRDSYVRALEQRLAKLEVNTSTGQGF